MANPNQYYPTPPSAGLPLADFLAGSGHTAPGDPAWDPCVGAGAIPLWLAALGLDWTGADIDPVLVDRARANGIPSDVGDTMHATWPTGTHAICNPPYGGLLDTYAYRVAHHARDNDTIGAILTRITWWGDGDRRDRLRPSLLLWLRGRVSFTGDGKSDSSTHAWGIWLPGPPAPTRVLWVSQGAPNDAQRAQHGAMFGRTEHQLGLFAGARA